MKQEQHKRAERLLDAIGAIDPDLILDAEAVSARPKKQKSAPRILAMAGIAAAVLLVTVSLFMKFPSVSSGVESSVPFTDGELWVDPRARKGSWMVANSAYVWPWDCKEIYERFLEFTLDGRRYCTRVGSSGDSIDPALVGDRITSVTMTGHDIYKEETHQTEAEVYRITGVDSKRLVAVRYRGYADYYVFSSHDMTDETTLGGLIRSLNLTETFLLTDCIGAESKRGESDGARYALTKADSDALWEIFLRYADAPRLADPNDPWSDKLLTFVISSDALGATNLGWWVDSDGYLGTNIENFGYYYFIGKEAVQEILTYVAAHKTDAAPRNTVQYLCGRVVEIGEDYIRIDDSLMMENPEEGIVFTVYANDTRVRRYITSGFLRVGQTVVIEHGGIHKDEPTVVRTATALYEAMVTDGKEILIPA